ncbi:MAG TPA: glycosyltransferase family 39 protein [Planctomycetota bacterium]|nr:glycosyltransferase family 39 protein [Planctomycetota bacterium]
MPDVADHAEPSSVAAPSGAPVDGVFDGPRRRLAAALVLGVLAVAPSLATYAWMDANGFFVRPLSSDAAYYRIDALKIRCGYDAGGVLGWLQAGLEHSRPHPPTVPMGAALVAALTESAGVSQFAAWLSIQLYGVLYVVGAYRLARNFLGRRGALWTAFFAASLPQAVGGLRPFYPQWPMCAALVWAFDAIVRTDGFTRFRATAWFGFVAGAATMVKMLAPLYFGGACLAALWIGLRRPGARGKVLRNVAVGALVAAAVIAPWYGRHYASTLQYTREVTGDEGLELFSGGVGRWSPLRWVYHPFHFLHGVLGPWVAAVAVGVGVARAVEALDARASHGRATRSPRRLGDAARVLIAAPIAAYAPLTLGQIAAYGFYTAPYSVLGALALTVAATRLRAAPVRVAAFAALAVCALGHHLLAARDYHQVLRVDPPRIRLGASTPAFLGYALERVPRIDVDNGLSMFAMLGGARPAYGVEHWPVEEFAEQIFRNAPRRRPRVLHTAAPVAEPPFLGQPQMEYEATLRGRELAWTRGRDFIRDVKSPEEARERLASHDFVIVDERVLPTLDEKYVRIPADELFQPTALIPPLFPLSHILQELRSADCEVEILEQVRATPRARVTLLKVAARGTRRGPQPESTLEREDVLRTSVEFANGWTLVGVASGPAAPDRLRVVAYFRRDRRAELPAEVTAYFLVGGRSVASAREEILDAGAPPDAERPLFAVTLDLAPPPSARSGAMIQMRLASAFPDHYKGWAQVRASTLKKHGAASVEIPLSSVEARRLAEAPPASRPASRAASRAATSRPAASRPTSTRPASRPAPPK